MPHDLRRLTLLIQHLFIYILKTVHERELIDVFIQLFNIHSMAINNGLYYLETNAAAAVEVDGCLMFSDIHY